MIQRIARSPNSTAMPWSRASTSSYRMSIFCTTIYTAKLHTSCHDSFTCQPRQIQPHSMICAIVAYAVNNGNHAVNCRPAGTCFFAERVLLPNSFDPTWMTYFRIWAVSSCVTSWNITTQCHYSADRIMHTYVQNTPSFKERCPTERTPCMIIGSSKVGLS